jgi:hypothetical protein
MGNFFGNVDDQSVETFSIMGHSWFYGFIVIGVCLLAAGFLVRWQVRRIERILARVKAEEGAAPGNAKSDSAAGDSPRG